MAERLTTRRLAQADKSEIAALYLALVGDQPTDIEELASVLEHPGTTMWGCLTAGRIVSMVTLHLLPNVTQGGRPYGLIENVVTLPDFEGQGAGTAAMNAAIAHAWNKDAYKVMLLTGQDTGAKGFYEKLGFRSDQKFGMQLRRVPPRQPR